MSSNFFTFMKFKHSFCEIHPARDGNIFLEKDKEGAIMEIRFEKEQQEKESAQKEKEI